MNKIMMVLAVLLVGLLAISAVSAETDASEDITGTDDTTNAVESSDDATLGSSATDELENEENDNEALSVDTDSGKLEMGEGEVLGKSINVTGDSFENITKAIENADSGDIIYLNGGNYTGNAKIIINNAITIIGGSELDPGKYATLDAQKQSQIFEINAPLTLQGIKFINGSSLGNGGAINMNMYCTLKDCIFTNNNANNGGAIYTLNGCNLIDCTFTDNTAGWGGAVYWKNGAGITNCTFEDNRATQYGGANWFYNAVRNVDLTGTFINNTARAGGANFFNDKITDAKVNGNFTSNFATVNGGANYFNLAVSNLNLVGNFINNSINEGEGSANYFWPEINNVTLTGVYINNKGNSVIYYHNPGSNNVIRDSIFINNAKIKDNRDTVVAVDSWFGSNATNYNVKPDTGINLDNWLFLNATANPNPVSVEKASDIIFKLSRYDGENISSYDNSRLLPINLNVTSTLGNVNPNQTNLNESITYTPESTGTGSITASFENAVCTIEIEILQDPELEAHFKNTVAYGEDALLLIDINEEANGTIAVYNVDDAKNPVLIANITVQQARNGINITGLNVGSHTFNIKYSGDESFIESECNATLNVEKANVILTADKLEMYVGDGSKFKVVLTDSNGKPLSGRGIKVNIAGRTYTLKTNASGIAVLAINLKAGSYPVSVWFTGDSTYNQTEKISTSVEVYTKTRITENKNLVKKQGRQEPFKVRALDKYGKPVGAYAKVKMTISGKTYTVNTNAKGYASLAINLKAGKYTIKTSYGGTTVTNTITVKK